MTIPKLSSKKPFRPIPATATKVTVEKDREITEAVIRGLIANFKFRSKKTNGKIRVKTLTSEELRKLLRTKMQGSKKVRKGPRSISRPTSSNKK